MKAKQQYLYRRTKKIVLMKIIELVQPIRRMMKFMIMMKFQ